MPPKDIGRPRPFNDSEGVDLKRTAKKTLISLVNPPR